MPRDLFKNEVCNVRIYESGTVDFAIVADGGNGYFITGRVKSELERDLQARRFVNEAISAFKVWFSDGRCNSQYLGIAKEGRLDQHKEWKRVMRHFNIDSRDYDVKKEE